MNRRSILGTYLCFVFSSGAAYAECNRDLIDVAEWSALPTGSEISIRDGGAIIISATLVSSSPQTIVMTEAILEFTDALGRSMGKIQVEQDASFVPNGTFFQIGRYVARRSA